MNITGADSPSGILHSGTNNTTTVTANGAVMDNEVSFAVPSSINIAGDTYKLQGTSPQKVHLTDSTCNSSVNFIYVKEVPGNVGTCPIVTIGGIKYKEGRIDVSATGISDLNKILLYIDGAPDLYSHTPLKYYVPATLPLDITKGIRSSAISLDKKFVIDGSDNNSVHLTDANCSAPIVFHYKDAPKVSLSIKVIGPSSASNQISQQGNVHLIQNGTPVGSAISWMGEDAGNILGDVQIVEPGTYNLTG